MKNAESPPVAETGKRPAGGKDPASAFQVNGEAFFHGGDPAMPLLWYLRDVLRLTGTKYGCDTGNCGACTVLIDGKARRACQVAITWALTDDQEVQRSIEEVVTSIFE